MRTDKLMDRYDEDIITIHNKMRRHLKTLVLLLHSEYFTYSVHRHHDMKARPKGHGGKPSAFFAST